jgi:predicted transcriptional regulator
MGVSKTDLFTGEQNALANMAKALAHPARIAILQYLLSTQTCINGDLVQVLGLAQPTISQHLRELKAAGLIQGTIDGPKVNYCIDPVGWATAQQMFSSVFGELPDTGNNPACC